MSTPVSLAIKPPAGRKSAWNAPSQRMFHDDSDDEGDAFASATGSRRQAKTEQDEQIKGFGANGRALGSRRSPEPLVIAPLPNRDWREAALSSAAAMGQRRAPAYRPERRDNGPVVTHERVGDEPQRRGLRRSGDVGEEYDFKPDAAELEAASVKAEVEAKEEVKEEEEEDVKPRTLDEEALAAVLAGETPAASARGEAELVIQSAADANVFSEEQALERDLNALPSESTLEDYDAVPVEAFGAAMLRGMGYDPSNDTPMHVPKPRPALLGIGATALSTELPPSRKDPKKRREAAATRGGRGFNAAALLVKNGDSRGTSREASAAGSRAASPGDKRRREDDEGRESKRRYDDRERSDRRRDDREVNKSRRDDREDKDRRRDRDRDGRRYETDEERASRKARERERGGERDRRDDRRDDDRRRERDRDRHRRDDRDRDRDDRDRRDRDRDRR